MSILQHQGRSSGWPGPQFPKLSVESICGGSCGSAMGSTGWPHQQGQDKGILGKPGLGGGAAISGSWRKGTVVDLSVIVFLEGVGLSGFFWLGGGLSSSEG